MQDNGFGNKFRCGTNINLAGSIKGNNNTIDIGNSRSRTDIAITINGDDNQIEIGDCYQIKHLSICCGSHIQANNTSVIIGRNISIEPNCIFLLYNSGNKLIVGDDCLFSNAITIRCGEAPHLIFDLETGKYADVSDGVCIGTHVWIGEGVYINKRTTISDESIVAARSVVAKRFEEKNSVLGGNPAQVIKKGVKWVRNVDFIEKDSLYDKGLKKHNENLESLKGGKALRNTHHS